MCDTTKAMLLDKHIALNNYIRKEESSQINSTVSYFKNLKKEEQNKCKAAERRKLYRIQNQWNLKPENQWRKNKSWLIEKIQGMWQD